MKVFASDLVRRCNTIIRRCPHERKRKRKLDLVMSSYERRGQNYIDLTVL